MAEDLYREVRDLIERRRRRHGCGALSSDDLVSELSLLFTYELDSADPNECARLVLSALRHFIGLYATDYGKFPKIQILTIEDLLAGKKVDMPWADPTAFKKLPREPFTQGKLL